MPNLLQQVADCLGSVGLLVNAMETGEREITDPDHVAMLSRVLGQADDDAESGSAPSEGSADADTCSDSGSDRGADAQAEGNTTGGGGDTESPPDPQLNQMLDDLLQDF